MYRCTECQEEFKEKPAYCNCGNDNFVEIPEPTPQASASAAVNSESSPLEYQLNKLFPLGFFVICIILSISIWFIKIQPPKTQKIQTEDSVQAQNIPADTESFWVDSTTKPSLPEGKKPEQTNNSAQTPVTQVQQPQKSQLSSQSQKPAQSKNAQKTGQKQTSQNNNPAQQTKPQPKPAPQQQPAKSAPQNQTQQKPQLPASVLNLNKPKTQTTAQAQQKPTAKPKPPQMNSSEFLKYKGEIRSALLAKLNVTAIQGSGECAVEFSLDSTGKLLNRNFIYKSSNKTVNDEVYLMLMRLPYYKQPPKYYNGEKIKLKFYFNNGYYEITFI